MEQVVYFMGCENFDEVNNKFIKFCEEECPPHSPLRNSTKFKDIVEEYQYIESADITFPLHLVKKSIVRLRKKIDEIYRDIKIRGHKVTALYFRYLQYAQDTKQKPCKEDLELIAELCGYNKGWVHYKELELKLK